MERIETVYKEAQRIKTAYTKQTEQHIQQLNQEGCLLVATLLIELLEVDTTCDNLERAAKKCKKDWLLRVHPDKNSGDAELEERSSACTKKLNELWDMVPDFPALLFSKAPGLTRLARKCELERWKKRCAAAARTAAPGTAAQKTQTQPKTPAEPSKPVSPQLFGGHGCVNAIEGG